MAQASKAQVKNAYKYCIHLAYSYYENFPIASFFLPKALKNPIAVIYAFARIADDVTDEGKLSPHSRLQVLIFFEKQLELIESENSLESNGEIFIALADAISNYQLPISAFKKLLMAFKQDVIKNRYIDFDEVLYYCRYSANPIGELLLHLVGQATPNNLQYSDYICTGLQLINFMQDFYLDLKKRDRCYFSATELSYFEVSIEELMKQHVSERIDLFMNYQLKRIITIYENGLPLSDKLTGLIGFEIRLTMEGCHQIIKALKVRSNHYLRPTLMLSDRCQMLIKALLPKRYRSNKIIYK